MGVNTQFLIELHHHNNKLLWEFHIVGGLVLTGTVPIWLEKPDATPLTISVQQHENGIIKEVPWTSIQTITFKGEIK